MKNIFLFLLLSISSNSIFSQKADTEKKKVTIVIPKSELFKDIKTYYISVQGDETWNSTYAAVEKKTYEHNATKNTIEDYSKIDSENPDVRVFMGYKGATYKQSSNGQYLLNGDFKYLVLGKNNEILYDKGIDAIAYSTSYNGKPYESLVNDLNLMGYKFLKDNNIIVTEKEYTLDYGVFEKVDDFSELIEYNDKTNEFFSKLQSNELDKNYLLELEKFYQNYEGKEYKKIKPKDYNKVIYLNLSLTEMFLLNFDKSLEYLEMAKQGAGMLSLWPTNMKTNIESLIAVNKNYSNKKVDNPTYDSAYYIYIEGNVTNNGKTQNGKLKVDRFPNFAEGSLLESNDPTKQKVWIYKENGDVDSVLVDDKTTIKTANNKELKFIPYNNRFLLVEETTANCYIKYESASEEVFCLKDGKYEIKK